MHMDGFMNGLIFCELTQKSTAYLCEYYVWNGASLHVAKLGMPSIALICWLSQDPSNHLFSVFVFSFPA